jgi:hypothetical protein
MRHRIGSAHILALIAIVLALGDNALAFTLGKNSVGSKQLKKNAVTTAKIKNKAVTGAKIKPGTITGTQINLAKLGTVPTANLANSLAPLEAVHLVGAPGEPPFENGAHNIGSTGPFSLNPVGFYKDREGIVHLQGAAETGKTPPGFVFTLSPGFRPASGKTVIFEQVTEAEGFIFGGNLNLEGIEFSGKVLGTNKEQGLVFDGVTFRAES